MDHFARYLPPRPAHSQATVTSNNVDAGWFGSVVAAEVFKAEQGAADLARRTRWQMSKEHAMSASWGWLALAQARAVIAAQHSGYATYLKPLAR